MSISTRYQQLQAEIKQLAVPQRVRVLAVTKGVSVATMREAFEAGLTVFGESYWQEASVKQSQLTDLAITWHFIGRLQSNKCALIAERFDWVHSLAHWHHAERLQTARERSAKAPLQVCVQVNLSQEPQKDGVAVAELPSFLERLQTLPHLCLRGLMLLPKAGDSDSFSGLATVFRQLSSELHLPPSFDTLSMGMSDDYVAAVRAGANVIRIGSGLFKDKEW